jgi:flagellar P-ring protein precursor FlgI
MNSSLPFDHCRGWAVVGVTFLIIAVLLGFVPVHAQTRIKDVATVAGARDNQLIGYGLVAGLDGMGDSDKLFTQQTVSNMARRFGLQVQPADITNKNVALVMITCNVPAFTPPGTKLNVTVASLADAKSLQGGVLLQTPLIGGDGQVYAVAQGSVFLGGFDAGSGGLGGATVQKNHTTSGVVTDGALMETSIPTSVFSKGLLQIVLNQGDFTSAVRMANAINDQIAPIAEAVNSTTVDVYVPTDMQCPEKQMEFVARIENALFVPDVNARIVINERTGTIVANANIQISKIAVAYGSLTVSISSNPEVSQPNANTGNTYVDPSYGGQGSPGVNGAGGTQIPGGGGAIIGSPGIHTQIVNQTTTSVSEEKRRIVVLKPMPTVEDVAFALNSMGATPRELMSILQSIKDAGALNAQLVLE